MYFLDLAGTFAFALSGAFRAVKYELDWLGVITLAVATGILGGIARDLLLGAVPPRALVDQTYVIVCIVGAVITFFAAPKIARRWDYVMLADAVGLSVFTAIGAAKAQLFSAAPLTIMILALITACGGGVVRDLLVNEIPAVLKRDFYGIAALLGGFCFLVLGWCGAGSELCVWGTIAFTLLLRCCAMRFGLHLPRVKSLSASPSHLTRERKSARQKQTTK